MRPNIDELASHRPYDRGDRATEQHQGQWRQTDGHGPNSAVPVARNWQQYKREHSKFDRSQPNGEGQPTSMTTPVKDQTGPANRNKHGYESFKGPKRHRALRIWRDPCEPLPIGMQSNKSEPGSGACKRTTNHSDDACRPAQKCALRRHVRYCSVNPKSCA